MIGLRLVFFLTAILTGLFNFCVHAQSRKDVKKYGIRSSTVTRVLYSDGKETGIITEKSEKFDKEGRVTDETEYDDKGAFRKRTTWKYNREGEVTEETEWNVQGSVQRKTSSTFDENNRKVNEVITDGSGKIISWNKYGYDPMGVKIFELDLDENGKTLKKSLYTYDKNGLKKERKTYNGQEELMYIRKYRYNDSE